MALVAVTVVNGAVRVDVEHLSMEDEGHDAVIQWHVDTPGWRFPSDGIVIENNQGQFVNLHVFDDGDKFRCIDLNNDGKEYKYDVKVTNGTATLTQDPYIKNGL
jgi:hypothetical protein